jgi:hypothetical protein
LWLCGRCFRSRFNEKENNTSHQLTEFKDLADLIGAKDKPNFTDAFVTSLGNIFQYAQNDVSKLEQATLVELRNKLSLACVELLPQVTSTTRLINRQSKHKLVDDVFQMGYSIVNKAPAKELDKIYKVDVQNPPPLRTKKL